MMGSPVTTAKFIIACVLTCIVVHGNRRPFVTQPKPSYDYIVVGAGTAGSVVASRLSEDPNVTVLLVEVGGDDSDNHYLQTPVFAAAVSILAPETVIQYLTEPNRTRYRGLQNGQSIWKRASVLGGGSSINELIYTRGSRYDFDRWAVYTKDPTWGYNYLLSYFKRSEKTLSPELLHSVYHSSEGLMGVQQNKIRSSIGQNLIKGFQELGYHFNEDYNGKNMQGITVRQENVKNGERSSTSQAFLHPFLGRANLDIALYSHVQKVIINNKRAEGVELIREGRKFIVRATREVILSTGTIETPKILMLSGIGPKKHLDELHIPVVADLPVGENLQDHLFLENLIECNTSVINDSSSFVENFLDYTFSRTGRLSTLGLDMLVFSSMFNEKKELNWPDLQFTFLSSEIKMGTQFLSFFNIDPDLTQDYSYRDNVANYFTFLTTITRPASRGLIKLRSTDPFDPPLIFPNYYDKQEDVETMIKGVEIIKRFVGTNALKGLGAKLVDTRTLRICNQSTVGSKDYWSCIIRARPMTTFNPVGTCKMGHVNDSSAVVDPQLKVRGVDGLRVADASIMPFITVGTTGAPITMIGEKAADLIRRRLLQPIPDA